MIPIFAVRVSKTKKKKEKPSNICFLVTTGWLNRPLELIKFWPWLESIVEKYTGAKPRSDDFAWAQKTEKVHFY